MALVSPGVQVTIVDESQYLPSAPASVPLILLATAANKANGEGTGVAPGTLATNANKLYRLTSQRDLTSLFGNPFFYKTTNGTPLQGYELNEYGLLTAFSILGTTNLCYVLRADIDLASLVGRTGRPAGAAPDGTYWLDINQLSTTWGIHEYDRDAKTFDLRIPLVLNDSQDLEGGETGSGKPLPNIGNIGDYAVTFRTNLESNRVEAVKPNLYDTYWYKAAVPGTFPQESEWVALGSAEWMSKWPTVQGTVDIPIITVITGKDEPDIEEKTLVINGVSITVDIDDQLTVNADGSVGGILDKINQAGIPFVEAKEIAGRLEFYMTGNTGSQFISFAGSTASLSDDLGIDVTKNYYPVELKYGTNAQRPASWGYSNDSGRPTGSVWVKTNAAGNGSNMLVRQYVAATETYITVNSPLSSSDWSITNTLDSAGGLNIPAGTVYAQYGFDGSSYNAPLQFFRKATAGPSVFSVGVSADLVFSANTELDVFVSQPGTASLLGPFTVSINAGNTVSYIPGDPVDNNLVKNWQNVNIPFTTISHVNGLLTIEHTEGGVIVLDDRGTSSSALVELNLIPGNVSTSFIKWGPYKSLTYSNVSHNSTTSGSGALFRIITNGKDITNIIVTNPGSGYMGGGNGSMVIALADGAAGSETNFELKVTVNAGQIVNAVWYSGFAIPQYSTLLSTWTPLNFIPNPIVPTVYPINGTTWYHSSVNQADIMVNVDGEWKGYSNVSFDSDGLATLTDSSNPAGQTDSNGPIISATAPEAQSDGSVLVYGDLWLDTSDLENYPSLSRWQNANGIDQWVKLDNTDQTTESGILFADARWSQTGESDPIFDALPSINSLLLSDYVDPDAPDASMYPQGTLLFNTRRSGYTVKEFRLNYFNAAAFPDVTLPQEKSTWVTVSGNQSNGAPYMGRKAQRAMIVRALKETIDSNSQIREEDTFFNLLASPGYPELQPNLVLLNNDRNQTAYIIGDTPLRLADDANEIVSWATNAANATGTGEEGLVTRDTFMGLYYPSGIATDPTGSEVAVPSSHMILRTMIYNDTVAYPWFAPAGQRRGVIDNANNIGYVNKDTGEFVTIKNRAALRDVEYTNFINPISFFTNLGLLNFGNKNSFDSQSALDRTNVARLVCYLRWNLQIALRPFIFEPNDNITRSQARSVVQSLLADIQTKRGIYDYLVVCDESNNTPARIDRSELWVDVAIEPVKAAEFIYIPVRILNTGEISSGQ